MAVTGVRLMAVTGLRVMAVTCIALTASYSPPQAPEVVARSQSATELPAVARRHPKTGAPREGQTGAHGSHPQTRKRRGPQDTSALQGDEGEASGSDEEVRGG